MVWYRDLRDPGKFAPAERDWVSRRLLSLRAALKAAPPRGVPVKTKDAGLIIGTWNLRDFDNNKFRHGPRRQESLFYIAEILSAFDVCAVQEVGADLGPLKAVLRIMGPNYDFIATDVTEGPSGNRERMAFVFDTRKITFRNVAGEVVLSRSNLIKSERQFARTPFLVSFQAGWFRFTLCTVHIYFGSNAPGSAGYRRRVDEIRNIADEMADRAAEEDENYILLGDFNIRNRVGETMDALLQAGFQLPPELFASNISRTKYYDQIAFRTRPGEVTFLNAGAFDFADVLFTKDQYKHYAPVLPKRHRDLGPAGRPRDEGADRDYYLKRWRTWQISDHLPLWVELAIDFSDEHLAKNLEPALRRRGPPAQLEWEEDENGALKRAGPLVADIDTGARKDPERAPREKTGTTDTRPPLTLGEAWRILKWVASGKADEARRARRARKKNKRG